ncbi:MAG: thiol:disulfide interchange protein DsbA/DsbL [Gammaproteobacteria bacterium]|nr:thiol:disulfide interchange protein DsbA/DsbL [Gammaproteobacteria bacterium]
MQNMFIAIVLLVTPMLVFADSEYQSDVHYQALVPEQPGAEGKNVRVMGFFWYGCGHCSALEPYLDKWLEQKAEDVEFMQVPAMFNRPDVIMHAKTYYALNQIGAKPDIHAKIFHAMHVEQKRLRTEEEMEKFLQTKGIDMDAYRKAMTSFAVQTSVRKAAVLAENYEVRGVPSLAVDGKYKIGGLEGEDMIGVMNHLIDEVRKGKAIDN